MNREHEEEPQTPINIQPTDDPKIPQGFYEDPADDWDESDWEGVL